MGNIALTVGQTAILIASQTGASSDYLARQIRTFLQHGLLEASEYRGNGPTAAAVLTAEGWCKARLLFALANAHEYDVRLLKQVSYWMEAAADIRLADQPFDAFNPASGLRAAVWAAENDRSKYWTYDLIAERCPSQGGLVRFVGGFRRSDQEAYPEHDPRALNYRYAQSPEDARWDFESLLSFPATDFFVPLLTAASSNA